MNIIQTNETDKKGLYNLTRSPKIRKMSDAIGQQLAVATYAIYTDDKEDGSSVDILSIQDQDGTVYATNSATALSEFEGILEIMGDDPFSVEIIQGLSKAGRNFITLALV